MVACITIFISIFMFKVNFKVYEIKYLVTEEWAIFNFTYRFLNGINTDSKAKSDNKGSNISVVSEKVLFFI